MLTRGGILGNLKKFKSHDIYKESHDVMQCVWTEERRSFYVPYYRLKIKALILDLKQQRNAAVYQDLQAEMMERGFRKPFKNYALNKGKLSNRCI